MSKAYLRRKEPKIVKVRERVFWPPITAKGNEIYSWPAVFASSTTSSNSQYLLFNQILGIGEGKTLYDFVSLLVSIDHRKDEVGPLYQSAASRRLHLL